MTALALVCILCMAVLVVGARCAWIIATNDRREEQ